MKTHRLMVAAPFILLLTLPAIVSRPLEAQTKGKFTSKDLPSAVTKAFGKSYPHARIIGASKEREQGKTLYEIESMDGAQRRDLVYSATGNVVEIEEAVAFDSLPKPVQDAVLKKFSAEDVKKTERLVRGETNAYEITVVDGNRSQEIVIREDGTIVTGKDKSAKVEEED